MAPKSFDLTVKGHTTKRKAEKEPTFEVEFKTKADLLPSLAVKLKSNKKAIFEAYPLQRKVTVTFSEPQKRINEP